MQLLGAADRIGRTPGFNFGFCAVVATRDIVYGIARMFEVYAGRYFQEVMVFREVDTAESWLAEQRGRAGR